MWDSYQSGLEGDLSALDRDRRLRRDVDSEMNGKTALKCFDAWAAEVVHTGHLHNHARMWFASICIFTLGLPWRLGADFFLPPSAGWRCCVKHAGLAVDRRPAYAVQTQSGRLAKHRHLHRRTL